LLAMEAARREVAQGRTGRLLCFNRLLGHRITADMGHLPGLTVGTLHQELLRLADVPAPQPADPDFWSQALPDLAMEALLEAEGDPAGDFLIIDEVQDIAREPYLDVLDLLIKGGLKCGRVLLFGDFERQAIFEAPDGRELLKSRVSGMTSHRLTANCRNLPRIGYLVNSFSKLQPGYQRFRRQDDGVDPTFLPYAAGNDQSPELVEAIRVLRADGYDLNEIAVLSPLGSGSVAQSTTDRWLRQVLRHATGDAPRPGCVQHCTIHAFKGLESPAVIVTDLDHRQVPNFESLLYVGLTRARDRLVALIETGTLQMALGGSR
jgi:superfamily I DNA/RNA helicase